MSDISQELTCALCGSDNTEEMSSDQQSDGSYVVDSYCMGCGGRFNVRMSAAEWRKWQFCDPDEQS